MGFLNDESEEVTLSLHALLGTTELHTLHLQGMIKKRRSECWWIVEAQTTILF